MSRRACRRARFASSIAIVRDSLPSAGGALTAGGVRVRRKHGTVLRGITKRKQKLIAKGIAVADRKAGKLKKNTAKRGIREEGKTLY